MKKLFLIVLSLMFCGNLYALTVDELYNIAVATQEKHQDLNARNARTMRMIQEVIDITSPDNPYRDTVNADQIAAIQTPVYFDWLVSIEYANDRIGTNNFNKGNFSASNSKVNTSHASLPADGNSNATITLEVRDTNNRLFPNGGDTIIFSSNIGNVTNFTDHQNGTYTVLIESDVEGTATISATFNGQAITDTAQVVFT